MIMAMGRYHSTITNNRSSSVPSRPSGSRRPQKGKLPVIVKGVLLLGAASCEH